MKKILIILLTACCFSLSANEVKYDIIVAQDGSGNFTSVQEAINSVRGVMTERKTIFIKNGIYREKVVVETHSMNITLVGEDVEKTIISWGDHANMSLPGTDKPMGTFKTYTLLVQGHGFRAENLTIENNAEPLAQAVALHAEGDKAVFVNCRFLGNQDTIYAGNHLSRQYYKNCYIEGTTDFIFGSATVYFEHCSIYSKKNSYITAPSTPQENPFGFVFFQCKLTAAEGINKVYLGRPWRPYGASAFIECVLGSHILPAGWDNWRNADNEKTARFVEINNTGAGADISQRVTWSKQLDKSQEKNYSLEKVFTTIEDTWNPK
ncbi:MAG: pectin esterase [Prevotellaceae bacterium]|jgi:pectinesterase|nr:pectin esterase [Prevotellaceae bacterium]